MGILDDVQAGISRGAGSAQRTARQTKLKMDDNNLMKQRKELAAQLGASLYDTTRNIPELREGREAVFDAIASIDAQRAAIKAELEQLETAALASQQAAVTYTCPACGFAVSATDSFCSGCGKPVAEIVAEAQAAAQAAAEAQTAQVAAVDQPVAVNSAVADGLACPACSAPINAGDIYCMSCGHALGGLNLAQEDVALNSEEVAGLEDASVAAVNAGEVVSLEGVNAISISEGETSVAFDALDGAKAPSAAAEQETEILGVVEANYEAEPAQPACSNCGAPLNPGDIFCGSCGQAVSV